MKTSILSSSVAFARIDPLMSYPVSFDPAIRYPEYPVGALSAHNQVYDQIRHLLYDMGLDKKRFGTPHWNPLGILIKPGQTVVIKPNMVRHFNPCEDNITALVTHGSIIRTLVDYCYIALKGRGSIIIADAPLQSADFGAIAKYTRLYELSEYYWKAKHFPISIIDLRMIICEPDQPLKKVQKTGDPLGYAVIDLSNSSCHAYRPIAYERYRVTDYNPSVMNRCHNQHNHQYLIAKTILSADCVINLPKLKTHRKAGFTGALKNLIGINCLKDYLPHHTKGSAQQGGDEYRENHVLKKIQSNLYDYRNALNGKQSVLLKFVNIAMAINSRLIKVTKTNSYFEGSWYGNDTIWRTVLDLNRILLYADKQGTMQQTVQRRMLTVVDGIVAGEKEGPLEPSSKHCGVLVAGFNPLTVDRGCAEIMGFDPNAFPQINKIAELRDYRLVDFDVDKTILKINGTKSINEIRDLIAAFEPPAGWIAVLKEKIQV